MAKVKKLPENYDVMQGNDGKYRAIYFDGRTRRAFGLPQRHHYQAVNLCIEAAEEEAEERETRRGPGRPRFSDEPVTRHPVSLTAEHLQIAKDLGDGNISAGVRLALDRAKGKS